MGCCCSKKNAQNKGKSYKSPATKHQATRHSSSDSEDEGISSINQQQGLRHASENQGIRYKDRYQGLEYVSENQGMRYGNQHQGMRYPDQHQGMRHDSEHQAVRYTNQHQGMGYATHAANQQINNTGPNDYYMQIVNLNTLHKNFMYETRRYQISVHRGHSFAQHHFIVVSDGVHEDITLELTVGGGVSTVLSSQENVIAEVNIFQGSKDDLDNKGVVNCTLQKLTEIAAAIIRENSCYNLVTNNCQTFCNKFLDKLELKTYMTDQKKATSKTGFSILGGSASTSASK